VIIGEYAVRRVGNSERRSKAGVDVPGAAFLFPDSFQTDGVVFAFAAYYRNSNPVRYQLWRPLEIAADNNGKDVRTSPEIRVQLLAQLTVTPSVQYSHETVRYVCTAYSQSQQRFSNLEKMHGTLLVELISTVFHLRFPSCL